MKVLSVPDQNWSKRVTCNRCQAELEIELGDLKINYSQKGGAWIECKCGNCHHTCQFGVDTVPKNLHYKLKVGYSDI